MNIQKVRINGFFSFNDFELDLDRGENIIVGTNGVGKTNFLNIITTALSSDYEDLSYNVCKRTNSHVTISVILHDSNMELFKKLFTFYVATKIAFQNSNSCTSANLNNIVEKLCNNNPLTNSILIRCDYNGKNITRTIKWSSCINCNQTKNLFDIFGHSKNCEINKFYQYISIFSSFIQPIENYDENYIQYCVKQLVTLDIAKCENTDINLSKTLEYFCLVTINNENKISKKYNECDKYMKEYFIPLMTANLIIDNDDISLFMEDWCDFENNSKILSITTLINTLLNNNNILNDAINNFLTNQVNYIELSNYNHNCLLQRDLIEYETKMVQCRLNPGNTIMTISANNILDEFLNKINPGEENRKNLCHNGDLLNLAQKEFTKITGKKFKIDIVQYESGQAYIYGVATPIPDKQEQELKYYECSYGERELIDFLSQYYSETSSIMIADEICSHLSSQNKINFRNKFLKNMTDKQIIFVTHDIEIVNCESNLIYFGVDNREKMNEETYAKKIKANNAHDSEKSNNCILLENNLVKIIKEYPTILFSSRCFFVEGFDDKRVFDTYCFCNKIYGYNIIPLGGKQTYSWKICEILGIPYKIIYDYDKMTDFMMFEYDEKNILAKYVTLDEHNKFKKIRENIQISFELFIEICESTKMKFLNLGKLSIKALFETLNTLGSSNNFSSKILFDNNISPNSPFSHKIQNNYLAELKKLSVFDDVPLDKFIKIYDECYKKLSDEYEKLHNKKIKGLGTFTSRFKQNIPQNYNDENNQKILQIHIDNIIENMSDTKLRQKNVYIWQSKYMDLEGFVAAMIEEAKNTVDVKEENLKYMSMSDIELLIEKFNSDPLSNELKLFLLINQKCAN